MAIIKTKLKPSTREKTTSYELHIATTFLYGLRKSKSKEAAEMFYSNLFINN